MTREPVGFVVLFANEPGFNGVDWFMIADAAHGTYTLGASIDAASKFPTREDARRWADKAQGKRVGLLAPEVRQVFRETSTRLTLGERAGKSRDFTNAMHDAMLAKRVAGL